MNVNIDLTEKERLRSVIMAQVQTFMEAGGIITVVTCDASQRCQTRVPVWSDQEDPAIASES